MKNQIFGYETSLSVVGPNLQIIPGTKEVPSSSEGKHDLRRIRLYASPGNLQTFYSEKTASYAYVWGAPVHPDLPKMAIAKWCAERADEKHWTRFRELIGTFVVIMDKPSTNTVTFVTDVLGIRPLFVGLRSGNLVFGSNVWELYAAGLSSGKIDYDSVSAWVAYDYNCTNGTVFSDLSRLLPGSVSVFQAGRSTQSLYAEFKGGDDFPLISQAAEEIHDIVFSTVKALSSQSPRVSLALSGGYDSRYLLGLFTDFGKSSLECATVTAKEEGEIASEIADAFGIPLARFPVVGSVWDAYDEVFHFSADGFPISKFLTHLIANKYPALPAVNGFLGDSVIRGSHDKIRGRHEADWTGSLPGILQQKHLSIPTKLIRKSVAERILARSLKPMEQAVEKGRAICKVFGFADLYLRQRFYISNNFLQHIEVTEALLPFYNWDLLSYKMSHNSKVFGEPLYRQIFKVHFPCVQDIPHSSSLRREPGAIAKVSKKSARETIPVLLRGGRLCLLKRDQSLLHSVAGLLGVAKAESSVMHIKRLDILERRVRGAGISFDWEDI